MGFDITRPSASNLSVDVLTPDDRSRTSPRVSIGLVCVVVALLSIAWMSWPWFIAWRATDYAADALASGDLEAASRAADLAANSLPNNPAVYRLRAQVGLRRGDASSAVADLEQAARLSPLSLVILYDLAAAYEVAGRHSDADATWRSLGFVAEHLEHLGDSTFAQGFYSEAFAWYQRAARADPGRDQALLFRLAISGALSGRADAHDLLAQFGQLSPGFQVYPLQPHATRRVEGGAMRWMGSIPGSGLPLSYASHQMKVGFFYWSGSAVALFDVAEPGAYILRVHVRHSVPSPVHMALGLNGARLSEASLDRGDGTWSTIEMPLQMSAGLNAPQIWFLNDAITPLGDRDAAVAWLELAPVHP